MRTVVTRGHATTAALHRAVQELLVEVGYGRLTIEAVAARSGVAKTSIYRRWSSKAEMVFDLGLHAAAELPALDDRGSLAGDLEALSARVVAVVAGPSGRRIFPGLISDVASDPVLMQRFRATFVADGRDEITQVLERSVSRGDLTDASAAQDLQAVLIGGALMFALLEPVVDEEVLRNKVTDLAMAVIDQRRRSASNRQEAALPPGSAKHHDGP